MSSINTEDEPQLDDNFRSDLRQGVRHLQNGTFITASECIPEPLVPWDNAKRALRVGPTCARACEGHTTTRNSSRTCTPMAPAA